jgi:uncharacterized protein (UPF0332 family)/DNA-binding CsgD family transcriptional regulator
MNNVQIGLFRKARRALGAVRVTLDIGDGDAAVNRAYYAMFYAATAALVSVGERPKTHHGTCLRFQLHFIRSGRLEATIGRMLIRARNLRLRSENEAVSVDSHAISNLSADAERFVNSVEKMLWAGSGGSLAETAPPAAGFDAIRKANVSVVSRSSSVALETLRPPDPYLASLTRRERDVLELLVEGRTSPQIAEALFVAPSTVCYHVRHIYEKLHVHTRGQAVACALGRRVA